MPVLLGNAIAILMVLALVWVSAREIVKSHKSGGCGGNCAGCSCSGSCSKCGGSCVKEQDMTFGIDSKYISLKTGDQYERCYYWRK